MSSRIVNVHEQEYNGRHFRSTLEAQTAKVLDTLGIPYHYEERNIELMEGFRSPFQKEKVRAIHYKPDFEIGNIMLECKGFETPEWKLKKKLLFRWLQDHEPETIFYQIHDARKSLLEVLDQHWSDLGYQVEITNKPTRKQPSEAKTYPSVQEAMTVLHLKGKPLGSIMGALTHSKAWVYGYHWQLIKVKS